MKLSCSHCGQESIDGHLWCERVDCPAGNVPTTLTYGEYLGDIKVVRLLRVFRTAAIYEGQREDTKVLLKVAHTNRDYQLRLEEEARILAKIINLNVPHLPRLLPPYVGADIETHPYGKAVFRGETKYYELFEYMRGVFLRDLLYENPEPWYRHAAWITIAVSEAISHLHGYGKVLHAALSPDIVLVDFDEKTRVPRTMLLDMGLMLKSSPPPNQYDSLLDYIPASYAAPELVRGEPIGNHTDVYVVGLLLYEMLAGQPAYPFTLKSTREIHDLIRSQPERPPRLDRRDIPHPEKVEEIFQRSLHSNLNLRYKSLGEQRDLLLGIFGEAPEPKKPFHRDPQRIFYAVIAAASGLAVVFLLAVMISALFD